MTFSPDWTVPTGDHEKWGRLDRIAITEEDHAACRTRVSADWRPFAAGTVSPALADEWMPPADVNGIPAELAALAIVGEWRLTRVLGAPPLQISGPVHRLQVSPDDRVLLAAGTYTRLLACCTTGREIPFPAIADEPYWHREFGMTRDGDVIGIATYGRSPTARYVYPRPLTGPPEMLPGSTPEPDVDFNGLHVPLVFAAWEHGWDDVPSYRLADLTRRSQAQRVLAAAADQRLFISDRADVGRVLRPGSPPQMMLVHSGGHVDSAAFSPDSQLLAVGVRGVGVKLFRFVSGSDLPVEVRTLPVRSRQIRAITFSRDGQLIAAGGGDRTVRVWRVDSGDGVAVFRNAQTESVTALAFLRARPLIVSGGGDGTVRMHNIRTGETLVGAGHTGKARDAGFTADGRTLITGSRDKTAIIWDVDARMIRARLTGHTRTVNSVAITPDGGRAFTGGADKKIRVWDVAAAECVRTLEGHQKAVKWLRYHDGFDHLMSIDSDYTAILWNCATGDLVKRIAAGKPFSERSSMDPTKSYLVVPDGGGFWLAVADDQPAWHPIGSQPGKTAPDAPPDAERLVGFNPPLEAAGDQPLHKEISPDGSRLAITLNSGRVLIFERNRPTPGTAKTKPAARKAVRRRKKR